MRYIKKFSLFESLKLRDIDLKNIWDVDSYMECLAYFENNIQKANNLKDFQMWLASYAYRDFLLGSNYYHLKDQMKGREQEYQSKILDPSQVNPSGFNFETQTLEYPLMKDIISAIGSFLFTVGNVSNIYDKSIREGITSIFKNIIFNTLHNIFWPGYLKNIENLKCLDALDEKAKISYEIESNINKALESSLSEYSRMEKDPKNLSNKFIALLEEIGKNNIRTFENVIFPPLMDKVIIDYFSSSDPETFKKADMLRNTNVPLFDKIKELLPNIDTAADLGDLGF